LIVKCFVSYKYLIRWFTAVKWSDLELTKCSASFEVALTIFD
jgi:hypothetical protein